MIAATARKYLANLAGDAQADDTLARQLAEAHFRLSRVEIDTSQSRAAQQDLEQAVALLKRVRADCCGPAADRLIYIRVLTDLARHCLVARDVAAASSFSAEAVERTRAWTADSPRLPEAQLALMLALGTHGSVQRAAGKLGDARKSLTEASEVGARLVSASPADDELAYEHARIRHFLAEVCLLLKDAPATNEHASKAAETLGRLVAAHPGNARWRTLWAMAASTRAAGLGLLWEQDPAVLPRAIAAAREACDIAARNAQLNPQGRAEADNIVVFESRLASLLRRAGRLDEAVQIYRQAVAQIGRMVASDPADQRARRANAVNQALLGEVLIDAGRWQEAWVALADGQRVIDGLLAEDPANAIVLDLDISTLTLQAVVLHHEGRIEPARERCRKALDVAAALLRKDPAMEPSIDDLPKLRRQARQLGVPDPTAAGHAASSKG
jgi:tetratricopeptide (TPR) repeat protein